MMSFVQWALVSSYVYHENNRIAFFASENNDTKGYKVSQFFKCNNILHFPNCDVSARV